LSKLINIGFGNIVNAEKIIAIVSPDAAPVRRLVSRAKESGRSVDATQGRKTKAVLVMEGDEVVLSALLPETIRTRALQEEYGIRQTAAGKTAEAALHIYEKET